MSDKEKELEAFKRTGNPVSAREIDTATGLDRKVVDKILLN